MSLPFSFPPQLSRNSCVYVVSVPVTESGPRSRVLNRRIDEANGVYTFNADKDWNNCDRKRKRRDAIEAVPGHIRVCKDGLHYIVLEEIRVISKKKKKKKRKRTKMPKTKVLIRKCFIEVRLRDDREDGDFPFEMPETDEWELEFAMDCGHIHKLYGGVLHPVLNRSLIDELSTPRSKSKLKSKTTFLALSEKAQKERLKCLLSPLLLQNEHLVFLLISFVHCMHEAMAHCICKHDSDDAIRTYALCGDCGCHWEWLTLANRLSLPKTLSFLRKFQFHFGVVSEMGQCKLPRFNYELVPTHEVHSGDTSDTPLHCELVKVKVGSAVSGESIVECGDKLLIFCDDKLELVCVFESLKHYCNPLYPLVHSSSLPFDPSFEDWLRLKPIPNEFFTVVSIL